MSNYTTGQVAEKFSLTVQRINEIANHKGIGRQDPKSGRWTFDDDDVKAINHRDKLESIWSITADEPGEDGMFSTLQVAAQLDVGPGWVNYMVYEGKGGHRVDSLWRFTPEDVAKLRSLRSETCGSKSDVQPSAGEFYQDLGVKRVINAAGTLTRLGGTPMDDDVLDAMREAAQWSVRIEELQQEHERQNHEVAPADLSTVADERRDPGHASQPARRTMPTTPPDHSLRLPVRELGEYVLGGRVDAMRRLLRGH